MYKLIADYHTHTKYSHGKGTIEENVKAARLKGLKRIAISDHGLGHITYGIRQRSLKKIRNEIDEINSRYSDIEVLMGVEANLTSLDGQIDIPDDLIDTFDIILMGFHKAVKPHSLVDFYHLFLKNSVNSIISVKKDKIRRMNTLALTRAMERYPIKVITHPGAKIDIDTHILAECAVKNNVSLEINASHGHMTVEYAKIAAKAGASFVINSDAHEPDRVGDFTKGIDIAIKAGLKSSQIINAEDE